MYIKNLRRIFNSKIKFISLAIFILTSPIKAKCEEVLIIPIKGIIDLGLSAFVKRSIQGARERGIKTIILEMDTPGGRLDAADIICDLLLNFKGQTITFILNQAWSAGSMIALATDRIIMAPGSSIGSAEPRLGLGGEEMTDEKIVSALRARFKAIAEEKGHNKALAQAMVDKDVIVKLVRIKGENYILTEGEIQEKIATFGEDGVRILSTISEKGKLLNLSYKDAERYGLAEAICNNRETLLAYLGYESPSIIEPKPSWSENFVRFITHPVVASLLLGIGFWAIIIALRMPGFGIPEVVGISCILLFFWGHKLAGLAQWLDLLLIAIGVALILVEVLLVPGFGIIGGLGILTLIIGIALTLTKLPLRPFLGGLGKALYITGFSFIIAFILFLLSLKIFPKTKVWKNLVLQTHGHGGIQMPQIEETEGVALSDLRPAGKAKFGAKIYNVETDGEYIEKGTRIRITEIRGNIIKVKRV